jgi:hypothetical protein
MGILLSPLLLGFSPPSPRKQRPLRLHSRDGCSRAGWLSRGKSAGCPPGTPSPSSAPRSLAPNPNLAWAGNAELGLGVPRSMGGDAVASPGCARRDSMHVHGEPIAKRNKQDCQEIPRGERSSCPAAPPPARRLPGDGDYQSEPSKMAGSESRYLPATRNQKKSCIPMRHISA